MARKRSSSTSLNIFIILLIIIFPILFLTVPAKASQEERHNELHPAIGIDLGNSRTRAAFIRNGKAHVISDLFGFRSMPSDVSYIGARTLTGHKMQYWPSEVPDKTITAFKRLIGLPYDEVVREVGEDFPFKLSDIGGIPMFDAQSGLQEEFLGQSFQNVTSELLRGVKRYIQDYIGEKVRNVVITVPVHFTEEQKVALKDAATQAGLNCLRMPTEAVSALLAYKFADDGYRGERNVLVYHSGSSGADASVVTIEEGVFEIAGTARSNKGGEAVTKIVTEHFAKMWEEELGIDVLNNSKMLSKLEQEVEQAKINLSRKSRAEINVGSLHADITREKFEDLIGTTVSPVSLVNQAITDAGMRKSDILHTVVIGGSGNIPLIQKSLEWYFGTAPLSKWDVAPEEAAVIGAAMQADILASDVAVGCIFGDVNPHEIIIETGDGQPLLSVREGTIIPTRKSATFSVMNDGRVQPRIRAYRRLNNGAEVQEGTIALDLRRLPIGLSEIAITATIDEDEHLEVKAFPKGSENAPSFTVSAPWIGLRDEESERDAPIESSLADPIYFLETKLLASKSHEEL